ncbi:uncharacterized protein LOC143052479 [Mytilus galloprovincialis]|uniref:uncharacterized protein LOC143052479 n=1 Tax=Mytilus galloprovincialis TaxID=29158 RepID=UPI003F7BEF14
MNTIQALKTNGKNQPYHVPLKATVVKQGQTRNYQLDGKSKSTTKIGLADVTGAMLALCYDEGKVTMMKDGNQIMMRNYIYRDNTIIITSQTKLSRTSAMGSIPTGYMRTARTLIEDVDSPTMMISAAKTAGLGQAVSIIAKVVKEEATTQKTLSKTKEKVDYKAITLKDDSGEIKLSLWRQYASLSLSVGEFYYIANVKTHVFNNEMSLNNTYNTKIEIREAPVRSINVIVDGYYMEDNHIVLVCNIPGTEEYKDYKIQEDLMSSIVGDGEEVDTVLPPLLPLSVMIEVKGNDSEILTINIC